MSSSPPNEVDVVVIGDSLTGRLTALALAERGLRVASMPSLGDNQGLDRMIQVPSTPLNDDVISGPEFAERSWRRVEQLGVLVGSFVTKVVPTADAFTVLNWDDEEFVRARKIVCASAGNEPHATGQLHELLGRGVSMDAWSDAPFAAKWEVPAAVIGCGFRAAEEALQCVRAGVKDVLVVCESETCFRSLERLVSEAPIRIAAHARVGELQRNESGDYLQAIDIIEGDMVRREPCGLVFLARGVECDTTLIDPFRANPNVILAGLAHGIAADDYPAMVADVSRVVEAVCR